MSFLRLTAESSSVLDGEEASCPRRTRPSPLHSHDSWLRQHFFLSTWPFASSTCSKDIQSSIHHAGGNKTIPLITNSIKTASKLPPIHRPSMIHTSPSCNPSPLGAIQSCQWKGTLDACLYDTPPSHCSTSTIQQYRAVECVVECLSYVIANGAGCADYCVTWPLAATVQVMSNVLYCIQRKASWQGQEPSDHASTLPSA